MLDTTKPLSRQRRGRSGKAEQLTDRDIEVLQLLSRYKYLPADFLAAWVSAPIRAYSKRLLKLHRAGYIKRPPQQWNYANCHYRFTIYELDEKGKDLLDREDLRLKPVAIYKHVLTEFAHNVLLCEVLFSLEFGARAKGFLFQTHLDVLKLPAKIAHTIEGKEHSSEDPLCWDGLFSITYPKAVTGKEDVTLYMMLEVDCGTEPIERTNLTQSSHLKKALQYKHVLDTGSYASVVPNFWIGVVTSSPQRADRIRKLYADNGLAFSVFKSHPVLYRSDRVRSKTEEPVPDGNMLLKPWLRANGAAFQM